jgi:hypothetical protein
MYTRVVVTLDKDERAALMELARHEQQYLQDYIRYALREWLHRATSERSTCSRIRGSAVEQQI